jgi:hypothetical protein
VHVHMKSVRCSASTRENRRSFVQPLMHGTARQSHEDNFMNKRIANMEHFYLGLSQDNVTQAPGQMRFAF